MENNQRLTQIIKLLNDNRNKLSALYSLYNSSLIVAEEERQTLPTYFEQLLDLKNDANMLSTEIFNAKKTERKSFVAKNKTRINKMTQDVADCSKNFNNGCNNYRIALKDCGSLKTEYKHAVSELCKEFKSVVEQNPDTEPLLIKGYKQQVKIIKAILDKVELLISDYNVKRNKMESDKDKFVELCSSVSSLIEKLKEIA